MKKLILILVVLLSLNLYGQVINDPKIPNFKKEYNTIDSAKAFADSLIALSTRNYKYARTNDYKEFSRIYYISNEVNDSIIVVLHKYKRDYNPALEREGYIVYAIEYIYGRFLDIIPIWLKYVNPKEDIEKFSTFGGFRTVNGTMFTLREHEEVFSDGRKWKIWRFIFR
jgi:hypothetical protein